MSEDLKKPVPGDPFARVRAAVGPSPAMARDSGRATRPTGEFISPVPGIAPTPHFKHPRHGEPSRSWAYRDASGAVLFHVARFDLADGGKEILPLTLWREVGALCWRWKAAPEPRSLYGLDELAHRPTARILVVEGEKTADAARKHFPDMAVLTWPGGSKAFGKVDWSPLAGREVAIWPDADKAGRDAAQAVARAARAAGAASVALVKHPPTLPEGWDLADKWPAGFNLPAALALIDEAQREGKVLAVEWPAGVHMEPGGLFFDYPKQGGTVPDFLAEPFDVLAEARDLHGDGWGVVIRFRDRDGREKVEFIARSRLSSGGAEVRAELAAAGLVIANGKGKAERFADALARVKVAARMTLAEATGWHGDAFVMPHRTVGPADGEAMMFTGERRGLYYGEKGSLDAWREQVAARACGNDLLTFVLSLAFAGLLLAPLGMEGGGFHLRGPSSCGKTTLAKAAGSIWGGGGPAGFAQSWRATSNALEGVAVGHNDGLLILDELALLASDEAGAAAYQLASGQAKARSQASGMLRRRQEWRVMLLSTGEIALASHIEASRKGDRSMAGQELRLLDVSADGGGGKGVWQTLHGFDGPADLSDAIKAAAGQHYGHAGPAFLAAMTRNREAAISLARELVSGFIERARETGDTGQATRGAARFAVVAAAGELAAALGVVPWQPGAASAAALALFRRWADGFGRQTPREEREILARLRNTILSNESAFASINDEALADDAKPSEGGREGEARQLRTFGYRHVRGPKVFYLFHAAGWKEALAGLDARGAPKIVEAAGFLEIESGRYQKTTKVRGQSLKLYWVDGAILGAELGDQ